MFIVFGILVLVLLAILVLAIVTGRFSPKEGVGCFVAIVLVALAFFFIAYLLVSHPDWYRLW